MLTLGMNICGTYTMPRTGDWSARKLAAEAGRRRQWQLQSWEAHDPRVRSELLRPRDTMQRGWRSLAVCDLCHFGRDWVAPADLRRCSWMYVVTVATCPRHMRPFDSFTFELRGQPVGRMVPVS
jgi:hypothetical protein